MRTLVVSFAGSATADAVAAHAARWRHQVKVTNSAEEAFWLISTGSVDLLAICTDAAHLGEAAHLLERSRDEEPVHVMHLLGVAEGVDSGLAAGLIDAGADDVVAWPCDKSELDLRLRLAEGALKRREGETRALHDLRRADERFANVFHHSLNGVIIVSDEDGRILELNPSAAEVLGYDRTFLVGRYVAVLFPELFQGSGESLSHEDWVLRGETMEVRYQKPREGLTWIEVKAVEVPWEDGSALMVKISDILLRRELEQERIKSCKSDSIRLLAGGVAHDFNNILTAVGGNLGLLNQHAFLPPECRDFLNRAEGACERARGLAEQLATFAREGELATGLRDLQLLVRRSVHFALYGGSARPEFYFPEDLWPVYCDESQIAQVVTSLTLNADQAMAGRGWPGKIHVACANVSIPEGTRLPLAPGDYVRISFKDEGCGIPEENLHRIFDPYFTTREGTCGLGLATAWTMVRNHRGYLRAESVEGEGSLLEFFLPALSDPTMLQLTDENGAAPNAATEASSGGRPRVLFMDDEPEIREVVDQVLSRHGFEVYCAADGREAIDVYEKSQEFGDPFDVLLFDLEVRGGLGGKEAIRELRKNHPNIKALVTSGYSDAQILEHHREVGFSGVIAKPFRIERLVAAVSELASGKG